MKGTLWRAFLGSFVLFLLSCGACLYGPQFERVRSLPDEDALEGISVCGYYDAPTVWETFGGVLFLISISVAAGGALGWWNAQMDGAADIRTAILNIGAAGDENAGAVEEPQDAAREEVPALRAASLPPARAHPFEHFDALGRSRLEKILAGD